MSDFLTNAEGDLDLTDAAFSLVEGDAAIAQRMEMRYRTFLGESVYDRGVGCPWVQSILGNPQMVDAVTYILTAYGELTPGIALWSQGRRRPIRI
jgi:hypothetical protein